ncbi:MAG: aldo/keto reductase [Candidatus Heteroscillospira sp.]|jgi:predicted aldo/keto reductase-like oxidoreductase
MDIRELFNKKLGFGAMRLPGAAEGNIDDQQVCRMVDMFLERGFNYFDTAYVYNGSEEALRRCLTSRHSRDSFLLTDKLPPWGNKNHEDYERAFSTSLERCGVDYFDIVLMHNMGKPTYPKVQKADGFGYLAGLKKSGRARFIGFSFHDSPEYLDMILTEHPEVDVVQLQINYADWESPSVQSRACYEVAEKHGKPVIVMEPVKGGGLAKLPENAAAEFSALGDGASPASYAVRYAASLENVAVVLSGMSTVEQVADNTEYMADFRPLNYDERMAVERVRTILAASGEIGCTNCRYCVDGCPKNIPIPDLFSVYNGMKQYGSGNFPTMMFDRTTIGKGKPSDCIGCAACEEHCPQHLPIREHLAAIRDIFEKK